jgi:hypothetical protein
MKKLSGFYQVPWYHIVVDVNKLFILVDRWAANGSYACGQWFTIKTLRERLCVCVCVCVCVCERQTDR